MKTELNWHLRFKQQAGWTKPLRRYLYEKTDLAHARRILEVGCGTGAIISELHGSTESHIYGVDIDRSSLREAVIHAPFIGYAQANALALPFPPQRFDAVLCHFLLLWLIDPHQALVEMRRVTQPGGSILIMAEPDYTNRVDFPIELAILGKMQTRSLEEQGADPSIGNKLSILMHEAGITTEETGVLKTEETEDWDPDDWNLEWQVLESDLNGSLSPTELASLKKLDLEAWLSHKRILYVPTYFAWGRV